MQVQRTFKRREGVWGIVKGDKGGASQVAPLSPLTKESTFGIAKRCFASLNMTNGIFGGAVSTALKQESHTKCATKVAPPFFPSLAEGVGGGSLRASTASAATNRMRS